MFNRLSTAKYFTVLDLTAAYYQVPLDPGSRKYTAFICSRGLFEYLVNPMGITNSTETFQRMMNKVLEGLIHVICEVYLDDIINYWTTLAEHIEHVRIIMERLKKHNLKIKIEKCKFALETISYLSDRMS